MLGMVLILLRRVLYKTFFGWIGVPYFTNCKVRAT